MEGKVRPKPIQALKRQSFNVKVSEPVTYDDPATATIEALKRQSVVYLNNSVQIFRKEPGGAASSKRPPIQIPQYNAKLPESGNGRKSNFPVAVIRKEVQYDDGETEGLIYDGLSCSSDEDNYDNDVSNGWDDFGSDGPCDRNIDYICRTCGTTFQSSSDGEYYYCPDCKPPVEGNNLQSALVQPTAELNYAKYTCKNCGLEFYSKVGNYNLCEFCSGVHNSSNVPRKHFLGGLLASKVATEQSSAGNPFSWGYIKKECHICGFDFYNRLENWYFCPRCVTDSSSNKSRKRPKKPQKNVSVTPDLKPEHNVVNIKKEHPDSLNTDGNESSLNNGEDEPNRKDDADLCKTKELKGDAEKRDVSNKEEATIEQNETGKERDVVVKEEVTVEEQMTNEKDVAVKEEVTVEERVTYSEKDVSVKEEVTEHEQMTNEEKAVSVKEEVTEQDHVTNEEMAVSVKEEVSEEKRVTYSEMDVSVKEEVTEQDHVTNEEKAVSVKEEATEEEQVTNKKDVVVKDEAAEEEKGTLSMSHVPVKEVEAAEKQITIEERHISDKEESPSLKQTGLVNGMIKDICIKKEIKEENSAFSCTNFKFIVYSCKLCKKIFYSTIVDCFYCQLCCNAHSIINRAKKIDTESDEERRYKELSKHEMAKEGKYEKYSCKVCNMDFYSNVGEWDFCNVCNTDNNCSSRIKNKVVSSFTRKNVTFNRYSCNICKNFFFSSREDQDCCKKCTKIMTSMKIQRLPNQENSKNKWENVVYAKYICKSCEKPFYSRVGEYYYCSECNPETKLMIKNKRMFRCEHCDYQTHLKKELRKHLLIIPRDRKRTCPCMQCSKTAGPLAEGEVQEAVILKCKYCDYTTKHKKRLRMHKNMIHKGKVPLYSCKHCKFKSCHKGRLKCHIMTKHEGLKVYQCEQCEYATRQTGRLMMHIAVVHQGEKPYLCELCHEKFPTRGALKSHTIIKHEGVNVESPVNLLKCDKCGFTCFQKKQMDSHMSKHEEEFLNCSQCNFSTALTPDLVQHINDSHMIKGIFHCTMCTFKTNRKDRIEPHVTSRHAVSRKFKCDQCPFTTAEKMKLKKHVTFSHHRPKKYKKNNIIQHCPYCDYSVKQVKRFTDHLATVHPHEPPINPIYPYRRGSRRKYTKRAPSRNVWVEESKTDEANEHQESEDSLDETSDGNPDVTKTMDMSPNSADIQTIDEGYDPLSNTEEGNSPKRKCLECLGCDFKTFNKARLRAHITTMQH